MTEMYKYQDIKHEYGNEVLRDIRKYEEVSMICGRYTSHLRFNLQCKHTDVIPKTIKIKSQVNSAEVRTIIHRAEKAILNVRISETLQKKNHVERKRKSLEERIKDQVTPGLYEHIKGKGDKYRYEEMQKSSEVQKEKYRRLRYGKEQRNIARAERSHQDRNGGTRTGRGRMMERRETNTEVQERDDGNSDTDRGRSRQESDDSKVRERWVKNLSRRELNRTEIEVLSKGGGFAVAPRAIPVDEFVVATEIACKDLTRYEAAALRSEISEILERAEPPVSNLTKAERQAMKQLKEDPTIVIVPADKGKCLVVMDKGEYIEKMEERLNDANTYKRIDNDPTKEIKEEVSTVLKEIKEKGEIDQKEYLQLIPTRTQIPRMYGQPKIHKEGYPMREIVDGCGSVTKEIDRYLSRIFKTYVGETEHYVRNSSHFVSMIRDLRVEEDEVMVSYDVKALYPSIPQEEAIRLLYELIKDDKELDKKTKMSAESIIELFKTCVKKTYFVFNKKLYIQVNGLAIGAATSGFAAEVYMTRFEKRAIDTFVEPPMIWKRYVDDTFTKLKIDKVEDFLEHLNKQHQRIQFTSEVQKDGKISFLDTEIHVKEDRSTKVTIYRKETHTDQYLHFESNHHIKQKMGIVTNFRNRIDTLVTEEADKKAEEKHVVNSLRRCGHPAWVLQRKKKDRRTNRREREIPRGKVVIPYIRKVSEKVATTLRKYKIEAVHKPTNTIKNIVCNKVKDGIHDLDKADAIYQIVCKAHQESYVGETERVLRARMYEHRVIDHKTANTTRSVEQDTAGREEEVGHRRSKRNIVRKDYKKMNDGSSIVMSEGNTEMSVHMANEEHKEDDVEYRIVNREKSWYKRGVKEAIAIKVLKPTLNKDEGRHYLSPIYEKALRTSNIMSSNRESYE